MTTIIEVDCATGEQTERPMTPEEEAAHAATVAAAERGRQATVFGANEDAERLALVAERAADDPAYAALAELALRGRTV